MSTNHPASNPTPDRACAKMRSLLPLLSLQADGMLGQDDASRVRAHVATCARCQAELAAYARLDAALRRSVAASSVPAIPLLKEDIERRIESGSSAERVDHVGRVARAIAPMPRSDAPSHRTGRRRLDSHALTSVPTAIAALLLVALFAQLLLSHRSTTSPTGAHVGLPKPTATVTATIQYHPSQFTSGGPVGQMSLAHTPASQRDPRVVFADNLQINMCAALPVGAVSVTWLTTSPTFGLALVEATCADGSHQVAQVTLSSRLNGLTCHQWSANANITGRPSQTSPLLPSEKGSLPSWLPLPRQSYISQEVVGSTVTEQLYTDWLYPDQTYAAGRYVGQAYQPQTARPITLAGNAGWVTVDGKYTTYTFPLSGDQTFFFSGTASSTVIQQLAASALAHRDDLFPHVGTPAPDAGVSC